MQSQQLLFSVQMFPFLFLAPRADAVEVDLPPRDVVAGRGCDLAQQADVVEDGHVVDAAAGGAADMRVIRRIRVVAERVFADIEFLREADGAEDVERLVDRREAHRRIFRRELLVEHVRIRMLRRAGKRLIDREPLRRRLEPLVAQEVCDLRSRKHGRSLSFPCFS